MDHQTPAPIPRIRSTTIRLALVALLAVLAVTTGACSGSALGSAAAGALASSAVGAEFAAKAIAACEHAKSMKDAQGEFPVASFDPANPDASKFPVVAAFLKKTDATFRGWLSEMQALGTPPGGSSAWSDLLAAIQSHVDLNAEQITAAENGDTATFAADFAEGAVTQAALLKAAIAAGVADCANVDR